MMKFTIDPRSNIFNVRKSILISFRTWIISTRQKQDLLDKQKLQREGEEGHDEEPENENYQDMEKKILGDKKKINNKKFKKNHK